MKKALAFLAVFCLGFAAYGQCLISDIVSLPFRATAAVVNGLVTPYNNYNQTVVVTQPTYTQPVVVQPTYTQPVVVQPTYRTVVAQPVVTQPVVAQPVVQQVVTQPVYTTTSTVIISQPAPVVYPAYRPYYYGGWGYGGWGYGGYYRPYYHGWGCHRYW